MSPAGRNDDPEGKPPPARPVAVKARVKSTAGNREEASDGRAKMVRGIMERNRKHGEE